MPVPNQPRTTSAVSGLTLGCLMRGAQKLTNDHECDTVIRELFSRLSKRLPDAVDRYTPEGKLLLSLGIILPI